MRRFAVALVMLLLTMLLISACNLSSQPQTPTSQPGTPATPQATAPVNAPTPLPGIATSPGATWTPFGLNPISTSILSATQSIFPTLASGENASISSPSSGASVSALPLYVSGVAHGLPQNQFTLQVFDGTGQPLTNGQAITLSNPNGVADVPWSASVMVRDYTGAAQIRVIAPTADGTTAVIGAVSINIIAGSSSGAPQPSTSNGAFSGSITSPTNGSTVSGDPLTVTGTAGGIPNNQFTLLLLDSSGTIINSSVITLTGADQNAVPWTASLGTSGHHGSSEIRAVAINNGQQITLASVKVTIQ